MIYVITWRTEEGNLMDTTIFSDLNSAISYVEQAIVGGKYIEWKRDVHEYKTRDGYTNLVVEHYAILHSDQVATIKAIRVRD